MTRFYGKVGFTLETVERPPGSGVWVENIAEFPYYGDVNRNTRRIQEGESVNYDLFVNNQISIVADAYATENFFKIRYIQWAGALWVVTTVDVERPRLILTLGGVYNGPTAESSGDS